MTSSSRLPIKIDPTSNGEFRPVPLTETVAAANALARRADRRARQAGRRARGAPSCSRCAAPRPRCSPSTRRSRRAATPAAPSACRTRRRSRPRPPRARSPATSSSSTSRPTWSIRPASGARNAGQYWEQILASFPQGSCGDADPVDCFSAEQFIKHVFLDSDTDLAVLSFVPELPEHNPLSLEEAERVRVLVEQMEGAHRLFLHAMVVPNAARDRAAEADGGGGRALPDRGLEVLHPVGARTASAGSSTAPTSASRSSSRRARSACATSASTRACCSRASPRSTGAAPTSAGRPGSTPT